MASQQTPAPGLIRRAWQRVRERPPEAPPIRCKVCDRGELELKDLNRMSGPVVMIGVILLIFSLIGTVLCAIAFFSLLSEAQQDLSRSGLVGVSAGMWITIAIGIACFVGGLLGWLLVMRKRVLQCSFCSAVINAS
jgi:hypothetical protein